MNFQGVKEREWTLDSPVRYIKIVGGPANKEGLLLGLKNGQVSKIFLDNPFPVELLKISVPIRCLDLSSSRQKVAIVDDNNTCSVYQLSNGELLCQVTNRFPFLAIEVEIFVTRLFHRERRSLMQIALLGTFTAKICCVSRVRIG